MEGNPTGQQIIERLLRDPENWELRLAAAAALSAEGRPGEAVTLLDSAPSPPETEPETLQCAEIYAATQPIKAVNLLHGWLQTYPSAAIVHLAMADTALRLGDRTGAQAYYQRAIQLQPAYRDPDLELRYGLAAAQVPPPPQMAAAPAVEPPLAPVAPVETAPPAPLPAAPDIEETKSSSNPKKTGRSKPAGPPAMEWVVTLGTAAGVFLVGWLCVVLALRATIGH
jgi:tetratricopeptide (TPR) repeat protein